MILSEQLHEIPYFETIEYDEDDDIFKEFGEGWVYVGEKR